ncbi:ABC transporter permease [Nocardioides sp. YIM 152588]|uniref:ABC transporter permease n=1 Tax=Nocardioides sp. YIM 152588 TaxID=3158259 RepID=UPI0032E3FA5F
MPARPSLLRRVVARLVGDELGVVISLVLMVAVVGFFNPDFLLVDNLVETARQSCYVGIMALGMVFALSMREVDLSVGGTYALTIVFSAVLMRDGWNPWAAAAAGLVVSGLCGLGTGLFVTYTRVPSFIATLGTMSVYRGLALAISDGRQVGGVPVDSSFVQVLGGDILGIPAALWVLVLLATALTFVFTRTRFGGQVRAIGSNPEAAAFSGIRHDRVRIKVLVVTGLCAGVAGVLTTAFFASGDPTVGAGYELLAIAACIIGGTPLRGGSGSIPGAALGALILSVVAAALVFFGVPINWTTFATGVVILLAVAVDAFLRRIRGAPPG